MSKYIVLFAVTDVSNMLLSHGCSNYIFDNYELAVKDMFRLANNAESAFIDYVAGQIKSPFPKIIKEVTDESNGRLVIYLEFTDISEAFNLQFVINALEV